MKSYKEFLADKICISNRSGFDIDLGDVNNMLFPHQRDIVKWAIGGGKRAIFAAFGLGKTFMQLEILRIISQREGGRQLIIAPLGVRQEFRRDAEKLGVEITFVKKTIDVNGDGLYITNYESVRDGKLDITMFNATTLDEASVLRSYGSKTYQTFLQLFQSVKYRFVCTATPSPNKYKELIHYAGYLGVMDTGQALTRFFKRDSTKANNLTLHPHMEKEFWLWVSSWSMFLQRPSDLGYSDDMYELPKLNIIEHKIPTDLRVHEEKDGQLKMFSDPNLNLRDAANEKRITLSGRVKKAVEIINSNKDSNFIIWHDLESERHAIKKALPECVEVYGSQDLEKRENNILNFSDGKVKYLATKPVLSGSGCNFQRHCNNAVFLGIGFKFNNFIQAVHRIYRFLQSKECNIHIIYADTEVEVLKVLYRKWKNHKRMVENMSQIIKKYGLSHSEMSQELKRSIGVKRLESRGLNYIVSNSDCVDEVKLIEDNSIGLVHTSIPFSNHYEYTPSYNDFGHNNTTTKFFEQMDYLTPELLRILQPGRVAAIHVKDRVMFGNVTGYGMPSMEPFHCQTINNFMKHGFIYFGMITVVTDVVRENNQTYRLGWTEQCKDGSKMGVGCPEYILLFRKLPSDTSKAYANEPVSKNKSEYSRSRWQIDAHGFWRSSGNRSLMAEEMSKYPVDVLSKIYRDYSLKNIYNYDHHVKVGEELDLKGCLPSSFMTLAPGSHNKDVWHDVIRMKTLNSEQARKNMNNHICPLQFDIVDRIINRYSNEGDIVFDPFGGIMTVPYRAILKKRKARASELNYQYFIDGLSYLRSAEMEVCSPSLFDFEEIEL